MTEGDPDRALSTLRKRRGVVRASITRLGNRLRDLEAAPDAPGVVDRARQLVTKLDALDADFKSLYFQTVDLIDDKETEELEREQQTLDKHDDDVTSLSVRLQQLIVKHSGPGATNARKSLSRKLSRLERSLKAVDEALGAVGEDHDGVPLLEQHREQLADYKKQLTAVYEDLVSLDLDDEDELMVLHVNLEKLQFDCSHHIRKLLSSYTSRPTMASAVDGKGVKLPKLDVPTFDGDVLHWTQFWEQFEVSVHSRTNVSDAEKLVYLQQTTKSGSARGTIEGLSQTGDHYHEAIDCLRSRYNRPRLIHRAHVRMIMDVPPLKDGSGKELRQLHDAIQQHLRALKSMKSDPDGSFVTSIVELKLDADTMFEWQKYSQDKAEVPHYQEILNFIDLRAQASETSLPASSKRYMKGDSPVWRKSPASGKTVTSFAANSEAAGNHCILCITDRHPLDVCPKFKAMSHKGKFSTVKDGNLCLNCLNSGHFAKQCKSSHKCKRCQRPHHTLLHVEPQG